MIPRRENLTIKPSSDSEEMLDNKKIAKIISVKMNKKHSININSTVKPTSDIERNVWQRLNHCKKHTVLVES